MIEEIVDVTMIEEIVDVTMTRAWRIFTDLYSNPHVLHSCKP